MKPYRLKSPTHCVALNVLRLTALVLALVAPYARADLVYVASGGGTGRSQESSATRWRYSVISRAMTSSGV